MRLPGEPLKAGSAFRRLGASYRGMAQKFAACKMSHPYGRLRLAPFHIGQPSDLNASQQVYTKFLTL